MFWFATKRQIKKELRIIKSAFAKRDERLNASDKDMQSLKERISKVEGLIPLVEKMLLSSTNNAGHIRTEPDYIENKHIKGSKKNYEAVMMQRAKKMRPEALKQAIRECLDKDMRTTEIFNLIVEQKQLISKTQFYHYLSLVRNELRTPLRTEPRTRE